MKFYVGDIVELSKGVSLTGGLFYVVGFDGENVLLSRLKNENPATTNMLPRTLSKNLDLVKSAYIGKKVNVWDDDDEDARHKAHLVAIADNCVFASRTTPVLETVVAWQTAAVWQNWEPIPEKQEPEKEWLYNDSGEKIGYVVREDSE